MPSLPGNSPELSKHTHIPSTPSSSTPRQQYPSTTLASSSTFSSPPPSVPDIHVERSRSRIFGGGGGSMTGETSRNGRSRKVPQSSSGSYGRSYGLKARKGGGGFLLGMGGGGGGGGGHGADSLFRHVERAGLRSASDPISRPASIPHPQAEQYFLPGTAPSSSHTQTRHLEEYQESEHDETGRIRVNNSLTDLDNAHLDDLFAEDDEDAARIVRMAEGMSETRKSMFGARVNGQGEAMDLVPGRTLGATSRGSTPRPFLTSAVSQLVPTESRRRSKTPSTFTSSEHPSSRHSQPESPHPFPIESQLEHQRRLQAQISASSPLRTSQPLSPGFHFQQQYPRPLPFNQTYIPFVKLNPSQSTLARVAKARQYIDLFTQYLDLLESLPPAKEATNVPHGQQQQQTSNNRNDRRLVSSQHPLRKYNPLQTIRNRRLRNRQGLGQLDLTPWEDPVVVGSWVDSCIDAANTVEQNSLPTSRDHPPVSPHLPPPPHHLSGEKGKSKPKRSKLDWVVQPSELFADFYWMNESAGKAIMEDRSGGRIFRMGSVSAGGSNASTPSSVGARGSMEKSHGPGRNRIVHEESKDNIQTRWSTDQGERIANGAVSMGLAAKDETPDDYYEGRLQEINLPSTKDGQLAKAFQDSTVIEHVEGPNTELAGGLLLPAGPGITIGIGGGYISHDDSPYGEDTEEEEDTYEGKGQVSLDSRRNSSQFEDEGVAGEIPLRKTGIDKRATRRRHHHHLYPFGHYRKHTKREEDEEFSVSSRDMTDTDSTDSEASGDKKKHRRWITGRRGHHKTTESNTAADMDGSAEEDMGEDAEDMEQSHVSKDSLLMKFKSKRRKKERSTSKNRLQVDSDGDTNYESAAAISRSPSPAIISHKNFAPRSSLDNNTRLGDIASSQSIHSNSLAPPPFDKRLRGTEQISLNLDASPRLMAPPHGKLVGEDRGRNRKASRDEGLGGIFRRAISPMKSIRMSGEYSRDEGVVNEQDIPKRDSKDSERDFYAPQEKEKDKEKKNRAKHTVKKAKEKVGNQVERIKNGVGGLVRGKEAPQSVPSSNYASSLGSAGGASGKEDSDDDDKGKAKKSRLSLDLVEGLLRNQKKRSKPGHLKQISGANFISSDFEETATPSDASVDGDGEDYLRRGMNMNNDELLTKSEIPKKLEIPKLKVMSSSREHSPVTRRTSSGLVETGSYEKMRPGGVRLKRERSRLAEEIKGDSDSPAVEKVSVLPALGRVALPPIATISRGKLNGAKQGCLGKKDLARARALMLSTGIMARGMATRTQQNNLTSTKSEFTGTLQLSTYHHTISAKHLSSQIHSSAQELDSKILAFRTTTMAHLRSQILGIEEEVSAKHTPLVETTADQADELSGELSTKYVLEVKRLNDEVNTLARRRRNTTLKWVRRGGYVLLEWVVLGVMWWVWLIVVMVRMVRVVFGGIGKGLKWMVLWK